jgi:hypothetical protein
VPYWIETGSALRLAIAPRPRGGDWLEDDLRALKRDNVDVLISLLTPEENQELVLSAKTLSAAKSELISVAFRFLTDTPHNQRTNL